MNWISKRIFNIQLLLYASTYKLPSTPDFYVIIATHTHNHLSRQASI